MNNPPPDKLINSQSPYLRQHGHNPVNWHPWGEEALARARDEHKPILLSIGYSTCHWYHVMEQASFSNDGLVARMNRHFICIQVDRARSGREAVTSAKARQAVLDAATAPHKGIARPRQL